KASFVNLGPGSTQCVSSIRLSGRKKGSDDFACAVRAPIPRYHIVQIISGGFLKHCLQEILINPVILVNENDIVAIGLRDAVVTCSGNTHVSLVDDPDGCWIPVPDVLQNV